MGFCPGGKRAVEIAEQNPNSFVTGDAIVYNSFVSERLERDFNVTAIKNIAEIPDGANAVIRAHGIGKTEEESLQRRGVKIADATCPNVKKTHRIVEELRAEGRHIFILGDPGHPEAAGIKDRAGPNATVISSATDIDISKIPESSALVSQTTKTSREFYAAAQVLSEHSRDFIKFDTICPNTRLNQAAAVELAKKCDIMIIIGGARSTNTKMLGQIVGEFCPRVHIVESASDIKPEWFVGKKRCGIAAGLSTPNGVVDDVEYTIRQLA